MGEGEAQWKEGGNDGGNCYLNHSNIYRPQIYHIY